MLTVASDHDQSGKWAILNWRKRTPEIANRRLSLKALTVRPTSYSRFHHGFILISGESTRNGRLSTVTEAAAADASERTVWSNCVTLKEV